VRGLGLWAAVLLVAAIAGVPQAAGSGARTSAAARMVLDVTDFPGGAKLASEGPRRDAALPAIAIASAYTRTLRDVRWGPRVLLTVQSSAEAARDRRDALAAMSPLLDVTGSTAGRQAVLDEVRKRLGTRSTMTSVTIARARTLALDGGDRGVEVVLRMRRPSGSFLVGEEWVNVRTGIGFTYWVAAEPGLSGAEGLALARTIERRMRLAYESPPENEARPAIVGHPAVGATLTVSPGRWTPAGTQLSYRWLRCAGAALQCRPIRFATARAYTPTEADRGSTLVVSVTATDEVGSTTLSTRPTVGVGG
jgi:hypothetical protein